MSYQEIIERRSCRKYKEEMPKIDDVLSVVDAGRHAPSGMNSQLWHFTVVINKEKIREISRYVLEEDKSICYSAPVFIMVSYVKGNSFADEDTSCALTNMMHASYSLGLGSVWINAINKREEKAISMSSFGVPEGYRVYGCLALGYSDEKPKARIIKERTETVTIIE